MTLREAAERAGLDTGAAERALVAVGIPIPSLDDPFIDEGIFGIFVGAQATVSLYGEAATLQFSRVMGAAAAENCRGSCRHVCLRGPPDFRGRR